MESGMDSCPPLEKRPEVRSRPVPWHWLLWAAEASALLAVTGVVLIAILRALGLTGSLPASATIELELLLGLAALVFSSLATHRHWRVSWLSRQLPSRVQGGVEPTGQDRYLLGLLQVTRLLGRSAELREVLDSITQTATEIFDAEQASVLLIDEKTQEVEVCSAAGMVAEGIVGTRQHLGEGIAGQVAATGEPLILGGIVGSEGTPSRPSRQGRVTASMVVPIRVREEIIGVLCVGRRSADRIFSAGDLQMLQIFAEVVATCIRRTQQGVWMQATIRRLEALVPSGRKAA